MRSANLWLALLQLLSLAALGYFLIAGEAQPWLLAVLLALIALPMLALVHRQLQLRAQLRTLVSELARAADGNYTMRLLAQHDSELQEAVFSINELLAQLAALQGRTIRSEAARKTLLSNISHDIRTPLTSIIGYIDVLRDDLEASPAQKAQYVQIVGEKAAALKRLIDDLFQLAKLDADELTLQPERLDLAELAREAVIARLPELDQAGVQLRADIPDAVCAVDADRLSLQRIMDNLLLNALQHGASGGVLGVRLTSGMDADQECWVLNIWDRGSGIAPEESERIFERTYRADRSRRQSQSGSGLGLAIARELAILHGGRLEVQSEPGVKTVFTLTLAQAKS